MTDEIKVQHVPPSGMPYLAPDSKGPLISVTNAGGELWVFGDASIDTYDPKRGWTHFTIPHWLKPPQD